MPAIDIPQKLLPIAEKPKRFKIMVGGRGGGKSRTITDISIGDVAMKGISVACCREFQNSIEDSVYSATASRIVGMEAPGFKINASTIEHENGGRFIYKGLARNIESIQSMFGVNRVWVEEAQTLSERSIEKLTPTIREAGSEIWMSANPRYSNDPFSQRFIKPWEAQLRQHGYYEDDMHIVIFINYPDNPWFPAELEQERQFDYINKSRAKYNHIWLGDYDDTVENAIILPEWFDAAVDAHKKLKIEPIGAEIVAHDPSDIGDDDKGLSHRHGILIKEAIASPFGDVNEGCDWALDYAIEHRVDHFVWDGDGMGVALRRQIEDKLRGKHMKWHMFQGAAGVDNPNQIYDGGQLPTGKKQKTNKESFRNKRAQYYWMLRDRFYATWQAVTTGKYMDPTSLIAIDGNIEALDVMRSEVCRIPLKPNPMGLIQIMTKIEMRKLGITSPNIADTLSMGQAILEIPTRRSHTRRVIPAAARAW